MTSKSRPHTAAPSNDLAVAIHTGANQGIQGLRGIAILVVLLNHAGLPFFGGGYIGVDLFFVISGYLIGGQLLREWLSRGRIDLLVFYARRFRRLLPAASALLLVVMACVLWLYAPIERGELMSSARASSLYAANIWFTSRAIDYFGGHLDANPLLHLWSLAVEEQFYLVWPLLTLAAVRLKQHPRLGVQLLAGSAFVVSLVACIYVTQVNKPYAFFLTPFRVWEFAVGVLLAARPPGGVPPARWTVEAVGVSAVCALSVATVCFGPRSSFPGFLAVVPVLCGAALLWLAEQRVETSLGRWLACWPLRKLGDWSYSIYLWHWPLLLFLAMLWPRHQALTAAAGLALSVVVGGLSFRWIETPFRRHPDTRKAATQTVLLSLLVCGALGMLAHGLGRMEVPAGQQAYVAGADWTDINTTGCLVGFDAVESPECTFGPTRPIRTVVLLGDSHAIQWLPAMRRVAEDQGWRVVVLSKAVCPPVDVRVTLEAKRRDYRECDQWREAAWTRIAALHPDLVLMGHSYGYAMDREAWAKGLRATAERLRGHGVPLAYFRDTPRPGFNVPTCLARADWRGQSANEACVFGRQDEAVWSTGRAAFEAKVMAELHIPRVDLSDQICDRPICSTEWKGTVMFSDHDHLSTAFSRSLAPQLGARLAQIVSSQR